MHTPRTAKQLGVFAVWGGRWFSSRPSHTMSRALSVFALRTTQTASPRRSSTARGLLFVKARANLGQGLASGCTRGETSGPSSLRNNLEFQRCAWVHLTFATPIKRFRLAGQGHGDNAAFRSPNYGTIAKANRQPRRRSWYTSRLRFGSVEKWFVKMWKNNQLQTFVTTWKKETL